jgi:hypothetical protein
MCGPGVRDAASLIWINSPASDGGQAPLHPGGRESSMPVESLVVSIGVVLVFTLFSVVLAWAYHATNGK